MAETDADQLAAETYAERERLVALLAEFDAGQWAAPSLCDGWRVREVVAHITMPFRTSLIGVLAGLVRARFSFDRYADRDARRWAGSPGFSSTLAPAT